MCLNIPAMTDFSRLFDELELDDDERPFSSASLPPVAALLPELHRRLLSRPPDPSLSIHGMGRLLRAADPLWLLGPAGGAQAPYVSVVCALISRAAPPPDDVPAPHPYASNVAAVAVALQALLAKLQAAGPDRRVRTLTLALAPHVCVFAAPHMEERAWTSRASREACGRLESQLLAAGGWRDSAHMLTGGGPDGEAGILPAVLDVVRPALEREARRQRDRVDEVDSALAWTLLRVPRPFLAPVLPRLLGPALLLSDHQGGDKCMLGIHCLHHIISNTAASELRALNRADVVYEALFRHLHATDADVMQLLLPCLLDLLAVLESPPSAAPRAAAPRHHRVLRLLLTRMEAEHKVALRRVYAQALPAYLHRMGASACRHFARLSRVVPAYLEVSDGLEELSRLYALEALWQILTAAWPRCGSARAIGMWLPCLLRLLVDAEWPSPRLRPDICRRLGRRAARCVVLLNAAARGSLQCPLEQVDAGCCAPEVASLLATVTAASGKSPSRCPVCSDGARTRAEAVAFRCACPSATPE
ncbi:TELO2-interacting protein 2 isoform X3 [Syngnathus typhle]|uniref:TELO2-interacting protein 2 isoform X3 n=1 Tax=Syngnathus typhle TaxID=161592 RepID=UPI002A69DC45|nr:TELO2-interacting protein 2 isoform X3 [Syngnathus typhle]